MATEYSFGKIVTNGLVLCLDAADRNSYVSGSTVWRDVAGSNNGTLTNGPTFNTGSGGSIVFDGSNDYVDCGNGSAINIPDNVTVNIWFKINSLTSNWQGIIAKRNFNTGYTNYGINFNNSFNLFQWYYNTDSTNFRIISSPITGNFATNIWYNVCGVFEKSGSNTNGYLYKNSTLLTSNTLPNNISTVSTPLNLGISYIGEEPFNGVIASTQIYNRTLTPSEILQNYNAQKSRFGL